MLLIIVDGRPTAILKDFLSQNNKNCPNQWSYFQWVCVYPLIILFVLFICVYVLHQLVKLWYMLQFQQAIRGLATMKTFPEMQHKIPLHMIH